MVESSARGEVELMTEKGGRGEEEIYLQGNLVDKNITVSGREEDDS